ncbi:MAG TPA: aminodeoxychorismate synthase component I [Pseudobacteroides sp.]|uniref:aminodeoxychorismate synthase component I n=1 Tax=Pseudobacteroides sp. TaxID=1968840 RepID=UPI002F92101C
MEKLKRIKSIYKEKFNIEGDITDFAGKFSKVPGTVILLSGGDLDSSRYHIIAAKPIFEVWSYGSNIKLIENTLIREFESYPLDFLNDLIEFFRVPFDEDIPVAAGLFGYLSYDIKDFIEVLPKTGFDKWNLPQMYFILPSIVIVHDKITSETVLYIPVLEDMVQNEQVLNIKAFIDGLSENKESISLSNGTGFKSSFKKDEYIKAVERIKDYILSGDIYQANLSQRFESDFTGCPYQLFSKLYYKNPAPFFAFINAESHFIISTSPERFIKQKGRYVESRPIKGTRRRSQDPYEDEGLRADLISSEKDDAELSMIVDLMRNDIGRVCGANSVRVKEHKRVEAYKNVYHMVSVITGDLEDNVNSIDLIKATFPGGSITGCPKIRSMEIIGELEKYKRHVYTGSIGYISFHDTMDFSVAIRTATVFNNRIAFSVGGGIVFDSIPEDEFAETLHKGKSFFDVFI